MGRPPSHTFLNMINVAFVFLWSLHVLFALYRIKNVLKMNRSTVTLSHKHCWWAAKQSSSFLIQKVPQVAIIFLLVVDVFYYCFFPLSLQVRRRFVDTNMNVEIGDDEKKWRKTKTSSLSCVGEETVTKPPCPSVFTD